MITIINPNEQKNIPSFLNETIQNNPNEKYIMFIFNERKSKKVAQTSAGIDRNKCLKKPLKFKKNIRIVFQDNSFFGILIM